jgi:hypothetical protein
LSFDDQFI